MSGIFSADLDESIQRLGLRVLKSPPRSTKANAICERVVGTLRRECLDWIIPLSEAHLHQTLKILGSALQPRTPTFRIVPGRPGPSGGYRSAIDISASTRGLPLGPCQINTRRIAPRVLTGARVTRIGGSRMA
jgi:transposase InsO family protein